MKKVYYFDGILIGISIVLFIIFIRNIQDFTKIAIFILFITTSVFTNRRMSLLTKYPPLQKLSFKEQMNAFLLILGKISLILMLIRFGYFRSELNDIFFLIWFLVLQLLVLDYSYIYNDYLITLKRDPIKLSEISGISVKQYLGQYYIYSYINQKQKLNFNLSPDSYAAWMKIKNS